MSPNPSNTELCAELVKRIKIIATDTEQEKLVHKLSNIKKPSILAFVNAHAVNLCWSNADIANSFLKPDFILRDGIGIDLLFQQMKTNSGLNMNGTDFIPTFLNSAQGKRIALYGTAEPWLSMAADKLKQKGHNVIDQCDGFQNSKDYLKRLKNTDVDVVILGMGMPKQEELANFLVQEYPEHSTLFICGGAIIDFIAGRHPRAPIWFRKTGLEWLYRLLKEPKRLFKRYVVGNVLFLLRARSIIKILKRSQVH